MCHGPYPAAEHVFTAANMVVVAAELVPIVSSYLTVRAANAAIRCHLPHLAPAAATELENSKDSVAANEAAAVPPGLGQRLGHGWEKTKVGQFELEHELKAPSSSA